MSTYLWIDTLIIIFPFLITMVWLPGYLRNFRPLFKAILLTSSIYIILDMISVAAGFWRFNENHVYGLRVINLPLEELLFFIVVPLSCILILYSLNKFLKVNKQYLFKNNLKEITLLCLLLLTFISLLLRIYRTSLDLFLIALFFWCDWYFLQINITQKRNFWIYIAITFCLFFIFNYLLTMIPVLIYNDVFATGWRISSIPVEDFLYNFSLLSFYAMLYVFFCQKSTQSLRI